MPLIVHAATGDWLELSEDDVNQCCSDEKGWLMQYDRLTNALNDAVSGLRRLPKGRTRVDITLTRVTSVPEPVLPPEEVPVYS